MKRMFIPRTISQHKINNVDKKKPNEHGKQQLANTKQKLMQASNREEISKTETWENKTESIKAHIDMYKLTLHNVGYKKTWIGKKQTKYPPLNK